MFERSKTRIEALQARRIGVRGGTVAALTFAIFVTACGSSTTQPMLTSAAVPAAAGTVRTAAGENGNTKIEVHVHRLAAASRVANDATVYVVWSKTQNGSLQNLGALTLDDNLEGKLDTITSQRRFTLTVTPEPSPRATAPTHAPVFTADVNRSN